MPVDEPTAPTFFATPAEFRAWLEAHHDTMSELLVGFHKKGSGLPSITWPESVDQALCFGWIDGVRRSLGATSYTIRFTPRQARSTWSAVNIKRARELQEQGVMHPAGSAAFAARTEDRSNTYSFEQREPVELGDAQSETFRANAPAWEFFQSQPPSYRKAAIWWVVSAKREETRERRLATLIDDSAQGRRIRSLTPPSARVTQR
jgi:uncharacterized protein YdeI (YjbR/CyaY-like superfamily)